MADPNTQNYNTTYNFQPLQVEPVTSQPVDSVASSTTTTTTKTTKISKEQIKRFGPIVLIVIGLILLVILILLLFKPSTTPSTTTDPNKAVVLQWWGAFIDPEVIQPLIDKYKTIAPNVTIEYANKWPDLSSSESETKYKTEINRVLKLNDSVQLPDIFMVNNRWVGDYEKYLSPASNTVVTFSDFQNTYYPAVVTDFAPGSKIYGLPLWMDTLAIVYNKEMLASESISTPPTDWSQFRTLAQRLTKKSGTTISQAGFAGGTSENVTFAFELSNILMMQNGVTMTDSTGKPVFASDEDSLSSLNFLKDFERNASATWNSNLKNDSATFLDEDLAMMATTTYRLRDILKYNEGYSIGLNIGISGLPQLAGQGEPIINFGDYWGNVVTLNRPNKDYAWAFVKWLNEPEQLKSISSNVKNKEGYFGLLYPRKDMSEENKADEYLKVFNESLPYIKSWYMVNGTKVQQSFTERLGSNTINSSAISSFEKDIIDIIAAKGKLE